MKSIQVKTFAFALLWNIFMVYLFVQFPNFCPAIYSYAQGENKVRPLRSEFIAESGCPVAVTGVRTELDIDPFDAPIDARIYIDYKNIGQQTISGAKFRVRLTDNSGNDLGTFHAPDGAVLAPGQESTQKFRREKIDPRTSCMKIRVLMVKYADGQLWQSAKLQTPTSPSSAGNGTNSQPPQSDNVAAPLPQN